MQRFIGRLLLATFLTGSTCALADEAKPTTQPVNAPHTWLLHMPGISGETGLDRGMLHGLRDGGFDGDAEIYDWVGVPGIPALLQYDRNQKQAQKIADRIAARFHAEPGGRIVLTGHSAGTGLVVWALEKLPADVMVDSVFLLSPALSPGYDLSVAMTHVRGKVHAYTSPNDAIVLGAGTMVFGTVDGQKTASAGMVGFKQPASADEKQYAKLAAEPYDPAWMKYRNIGDHIGSMTRPFAAGVLAPLVLRELPKVIESPAAQPAEGAGHASH